MKKRLFFYISFIFFVGFALCFLVSVYVVYKNNFSIAKDAAVETAQIYADIYALNHDIFSLTQVGNNTRITIVSKEGLVLADSHLSDVKGTEDHLTRPEIESAAKGAPQTFVRRSKTLGTDLMYYALKIDADGNFVRVAVPIAKVEKYIYHTMFALLFLFFIIMLTSFFFINRTINKITDRKHKKIEKLMQNAHKIGYILDNITDGLFVVNKNRNVMLANSAALKIFAAKKDAINKPLNYLCRDTTILAAVDECINFGKNAVFEFLSSGNIYFAAIRRLPETNLTMVVLSNITEIRENAKRREEFFANASHELKTPLTAIKGFNELNALNCKDENAQKYIRGIERETERMLLLITDMLKLCELESAKEINPTTNSLAKIVDEAKESMQTAIIEKGINFKVSGDAKIASEYKHIYELVKNLIENAIRYNNKNGSVVVKIEEIGDDAKLIVYDDGIGISSKEQTRIFERFYRVEKSRSQQNGGTGLGLAIVKHVCILYGWELSLKSRLGVGTEVIVIFGSAK